jgi:hypothetical protein
MSITFGPNGFFGCGYMAATTGKKSDGEEVEGLAGWWSTFPSPPPPTPGTTTSKIDRQRTIDALLRRHGWWKQPFIAAILAYVKEHRDDGTSGLLDAEYSTYTTPPLPTFSKHNGRLILLGDSAHALQPSSGQGACQALEDAESYAMLLGHDFSSSTSWPPAQFTARQSSSLQQTATAFDQLRMPRIRKIYERSQKVGGMKKEMNIFKEFFVYFFIWALTWLTRGRDGYNDELFNYDLPKEVERVMGKGMKG